jgi:carbon storage regulator CsrA
MRESVCFGNQSLPGGAKVLVLSRKLGESVVVPDNLNEVWIKVVRIFGGRVQIAFDAPIDVAIRRSELLATVPDSDPVEAVCIRRK